MRAQPWFRPALAFLVVTQVVVGVWQLLLPRSFYDLYWVQLLPPYNEHLMRDVGALNLALAVVLGASVLIMERRLVSTALLAYLTFAVYHLVFHATHLEHFPQADAIAQTSALALGVAFPSVLLILAWQGERVGRGNSASRREQESRGESREPV
jgi:Ca2+/Na+ antiporter